MSNLMKERKEEEFMDKGMDEGERGRKKFS